MICVQRQFRFSPAQSAKGFLPYKFCAWLLLTTVAVCTLTVRPAGAAVIDEIQVYTDDINAPGEFGVELHANTTPRGRSTPDFPGELTPYRGLRLTPEFSYGITKELEAGLYMPYNRDAQGTMHFSGPKLRLKWLPVQAGEDGGWFMGANVEYAQVAPAFDQSRYGFELRPIIGYRNDKWLFATNPILSWALTGPDHDGKPEFNPSVKVARTVAPGVALGMEYYAELGKINNTLPRAQQGQTLYVALDYEQKTWGFNVGIGRGINDATDRWTAKTIFSFPFD